MQIKGLRWNQEFDVLGSHQGLLGKKKKEWKEKEWFSLGNGMTHQVLMAACLDFGIDGPKFESKLWGYVINCYETLGHLHSFST